MFTIFNIYSQTCANDHLWTTTCLNPICPKLILIFDEKPFYNDHIGTTATFFESQGRPLYTGLTIYKYTYLPGLQIALVLAFILGVHCQEGDINVTSSDQNLNFREKKGIQWNMVTVNCLGLSKFGRYQQGLQ